MTPLPIADWQAALDAMEAALADTLTALDRYQAGWEYLLAGPTPADPGGGAEPVALGRLEGRLREWDARLSAAADLAASVERELNDRESVVGRWQGMFTDWRESIQRG